MLMPTPEDSKKRCSTQHWLNFSVVKTETGTESYIHAIIDTDYKADGDDHKEYGDFALWMETLFGVEKF
jgi:hypothetical protein